MNLQNTKCPFSFLDQVVNTLRTRKTTAKSVSLFNSDVFYLISSTLKETLHVYKQAAIYKLTFLYTLRLQRLNRVILIIQTALIPATAIKRI